MRAVLTYHSIDPSGSPISVSAEEFRHHVEWLAKGRVAVVPLASILDPAHENAIALTFDDAFANFETEALPLLVDHGFPATLFVATACVGGTNAWPGESAPSGIPILPLLDWAEIARVANRGVEIGSHTRTHARLGRLGDNDVRREMNDSIGDIERAIGTRPVSFCYPYGETSELAVAEAAQLFDVAVTTELRMVRPASDSAVLIPRLDMYYLRRRGALERWGTRRFFGQLALRRVGRAVRRTLSGR